MLNRVFRLGMVVVVLAVAFLSWGPTSRAYAGTSDSIVESAVREADITDVVNLVQEALINHDGLSIDHQAIVYGAIGRTNAAIDHLYDTGATGDVFDTAEQLLLTQLDLLHEIEAATLSEDISDLDSVVVMIVDLAQRRIAFERQMGNFFTPIAAQHSMSVMDIAHDDSATRVAMARVITALATGNPVGLDISDEVYRALGETSRGLDLVDETFETGDVFDAAVELLQQRFQFLAGLEEATISGDLEDLRLVAEDWVKLSQFQLVFERQLAARDTVRLSRNLLDRRGAGFLSRFNRPSIGDTETPALETHADQVRTFTRVLHTVQPGDTLSSIADQYATTVGTLAMVNNITNPDLITPGQTILISAVSAN